MSLLDAFGSECTLMERVRTADGEGGYVSTWTDGISFTNYRALETSVEARRAEQEGVSSVFNVLVKQGVPLELRDVFRDDTTGEYYRVTSQPADKKTPGTSRLNLMFCTAERLGGLPE